MIEAAEKHTNPPRIKLDMFLAMFSGNIFPTLQDAELYRGAGGTNPRRGPPWVATSEVPAPLTFCICSCWGTCGLSAKSGTKSVSVLQASRDKDGVVNTVVTASALRSKLRLKQGVQVKIAVTLSCVLGARRKTEANSITLD